MHGRSGAEGPLYLKVAGSEGCISWEQCQRIHRVLAGSCTFDPARQETNAVLGSSSFQPRARSTAAEQKPNVRYSATAPDLFAFLTSAERESQATNGPMLTQEEAGWHGRPIVPPKRPEARSARLLIKRTFYPRSTLIFWLSVERLCSRQGL